MTELERLREQLKRLSLNTMACMFEDEANKASQGQMSYTAFLARLVDEEVVSKTDRLVNARIAKARFPAIQTLESFDFSFQPSLSATRIKELAELGFIEHADNVLFVGPTGTGNVNTDLFLPIFHRFEITHPGLNQVSFESSFTFWNIPAFFFSRSL